MTWIVLSETVLCSNSAKLDYIFSVHGSINTRIIAEF